MVGLAAVAATNNGAKQIYAHLPPLSYCGSFEHTGLVSALVDLEVIARYSPSSVTGKKSLPKNDFTRKMIDFDTFTRMWEIWAN